MTDKTLHRYRRRVAALQRAIRVACEIIELGDERLLAGDGPAGGRPPQLSLDEWRRMYRVLDATRIRRPESTGKREGK
jgi:hypothetical protein